MNNNAWFHELPQTIQEGIALVGLNQEEINMYKENYEKRKEEERIENKKYCKYCKWYDFALHGDYRSNCIHPDNRNIKRVIDNWNSKYIHFMASGEKPEIINQNNDCIWYIELIDVDKSIVTIAST